MASTAQERVLQASIRAQDMFTNPVKKVIKNAQELQTVVNKIKKNNILVKAQDKASPIVNKIKQNLEKFKDTKLYEVAVSVKDKATSAINKINSVLRAIKNYTIAPTIVVKDMATSVINKAKAKLDAFKGSATGQAILRVKDMATSTISKITSKLKAFAGKTYSASVKVRDMATSILGGISGKLTALAGGITIAVVAKVGYDGLAQEQTQKLTINKVIQNSGSSKEQAEKATEEYYKYLEEFANKTPFQTSEVAQMGTKSMLISKGDIELAKKVTDAQANVKAFVGEENVADCYRNVA